jgi:hypothetical protein
MNTTKEERKQKSIEYMKKLDIYKPYITGFEKENEVCYFEGFGGFWAWQDEELSAKIKEIEEKYDCTVYAVTHEITEFGEIYDFLLATNDSIDLTVYSGHDDINNTIYAFAYVWNKDDDNFSEFGDIMLQSFGGGIRRIG